MTIHQSPIPGSGRTRCCQHTPFELPRTDRITSDTDLVDCPNRRSGHAHIPPGLFEFIGHYLPPHPGVTPAKIRMGTGVYTDLVDTPGFHRTTFTERLLGLRVDLDHSLPPEVWQVYADDDTLLRDSRSTNEVHP